MTRLLRADTVLPGGLPPADLLLAVGLAALGAVEVAAGDQLQAPTPARVAVVLAVALPLAWRRVVPLAAATATIAALAVAAPLAIPDQPPMFALLAFLVAAYAPAAYGDRPHALAGGVIALAGMSVFLFVGGHGAAPTTVAEAAFGYGEVAVAWGLGRAVYRRQARGDRLASLALALEGQRDAEAERAVTEERSRIARELHDVVAHGVSLIVVQAQAARRVLEGDRERVDQALREIETAGRQALDELERMLGVMRTAHEPSLAPQPRLADAAELAERAVAAGVPVQLRVEGRPRPLPRGLDLAAYRILQEALTNIVRHGAGGGEAIVRYERDALDLHVTNDGIGDGATGRRNDSGHGLVGMRERASLYGGTLHAGPRRGGGFEVRARLPLQGPT